jgi:SAM-dependent methyltransferase
MASSELRLIAFECGIIESSIAQTTINGLGFLAFSSHVPLSAVAMGRVYQLSFCYAVFELIDEHLLKPIQNPIHSRFNNDFTSILKYPGKTNDIFTELLLNVAQAACQTDMKFSPYVLDPVCGRGTTLLALLSRGISCAGIDIDKKSIHALDVFLTRYLREHRWKHTATQGGTTLKNHDKADFYLYQMGETKAKFQSKDALHLKVVSGDTRFANVYFKKQSFDMIIGDLPYGIFHGSTAPKGVMRNPKPLLTTALPAWISVLKPNGVIALSWNTHLLSRNEAELLFEDNGLTLFCEIPYTNFEHLVDQSITRDIIVGIKEG